MLKLLLIFAMAMFFTSTINAQSDRLDTIKEIAACATLDRIVQDLTDRIDREKNWIERNRNNNNVSVDRFNKRVDENNGVVDEQNILNDAYKANCERKSMSRENARAVCMTRTDNMSEFIYSSPFCKDVRERLN